MILNLIIYTFLICFILLFIHLNFVKQTYLTLFLIFELILLLSGLIILFTSVVFSDNFGLLILISLLVLASCEASIGLILLIINSFNGVDISVHSKFRLVG